MSCCNDIKVLEQNTDVFNAIDVRGIGDIKVTSTMEPNQKVFIVEFRPYTPPQIIATENILREVGEVVSFTWNVSIVPGRERIVSRRIIPSPDPLPDLGSPFNLSVINQKRPSRQIVTYYTVEAEDETGKVTSRQLSIHYVNKVYQGYSYKDGISQGQELTESDLGNFSNTLADNIKSIYGGIKTYRIPPSGLLQYLFFVYEIGTTPINGMELSGLPFPIIFLPGSIVITNPHDNTISARYAVVRSANKFGSGNLSLKMM
jgi:hypothetical protein